MSDTAWWVLAAVELVLLTAAAVLQELRLERNRKVLTRMDSELFGLQVAGVVHGSLRRQIIERQAKLLRPHGPSPALAFLLLTSGAMQYVPRHGRNQSQEHHHEG